MISCLYSQICKDNFKIHLDETGTSRNLTQLMRDVVEKSKLVVDDNFNSKALEILVGIILQRQTQVRIKTNNPNVC